VQLWLFR